MSDGELVVFEMDDEGKVERIRRRYEYLLPKPQEAPEKGDHRM